MNTDQLLGLAAGFILGLLAAGAALVASWIRQGIREDS